MTYQHAILRAEGLWTTRPDTSAPSGELTTKHLKSFFAVREDDLTPDD